LFCGVTNAPLATIVLCMELFGAKGLPFFALAVAVSYQISGNGGLYSAQEIVSNKLAIMQKGDEKINE
ncbi:MAG TPA: chloride channel protein, partial [Clostridia bacterium]|nr:chloride channel protein [Clostridia bacterium]